MASEAAFLEQSEEAVPCLDVLTVFTHSLTNLYSDLEKCGVVHLEEQILNSWFSLCSCLLCFVSSQ